jgi:hypothetical protein
LGGRDQEDHGLKPAPGKQFTRSYLENTQNKKGLTVVQVAEHLPSNLEALSSNPSTEKKKRERD